MIRRLQLSQAGFSMGDELPITTGFLFKIISTLAPNETAVADWVEAVKTANPKLTTEELAHHIGDRIVWTYTRQGAALALPGAVPGLGTIAQIGTEISTLSVDLGLMVRNQTYLVFALGHCFGVAGREILIQDTLITMGMWSGALVLTRTGAIQIGTKVVAANFKKHFPAKILQAINKKVQTTILTKYGTKRGGIALGKLIPFGVGFLVGGGFNYLTMKAFKKAAIKKFQLKQDLGEEEQHDDKEQNDDCEPDPE
jgi:hypothetical protein